MDKFLFFRVNLLQLKQAMYTKNTSVAGRLVFLSKYKLMIFIALSITISFAVLYVALSPSLLYQHFDSLSYAYGSEKNGIKMIIGNHPLGHFILNMTFVIAQWVGFTGRCLGWFQIMNGIVSGVSIGLVYVLGVSVYKYSNLTSLGAAIILGSIYSFWHYAGTADIYNIAILFQVLAWGTLVYEINLKSRDRLIFSGILGGALILVHQVNAVQIAAELLFVVLQMRGSKNYPVLKRRCVSFLVSLFATVGVGYIGLGYMALSSLSPLTIFQWIKGYVGNPTYGGYLSVKYLPIVLSNLTQALIHISWSMSSQIVRIAIILLLVIPLAVGWLFWQDIKQNGQKLLMACLFQCLTTAFLIFWWEADNPKFWSLVLFPLMILFGYLIEALVDRLSVLLPLLIRRWGRILLDHYPVILGVLLLLFNLKYGLINEHKTDASFEESIKIWLASSDRNDILITDNLLEPVLRYWGDRPNTVSLHALLLLDDIGSDSHAILEKKLDDLFCGGSAVLYTPLAVDYLPERFLSVGQVSREELRQLFDAYQQEEIFTYTNRINGDETKVYRLSYSGACDD